MRTRVSGTVLTVLALLFFLPLPARAQEPRFGGELVIQGIQPGEIVNPAAAKTLADRQKAALIFPRLSRLRPLPSVKRSFVLRSVVRPDNSEITLYLRDRTTNPAGKLISSLDIKAMLKQYLKVGSRGDAFFAALQRLRGSADFLGGETEDLAGLKAEGEDVIRLLFEDAHMLPVSAFADISLAASRYFVEPAYLSTDRGPFFRNSPGNYSANLQYCFGRPYLDRIVLAGAEGGGTPAENRVVLNFNQVLSGLEREDGRALQYPGEKAVYLATNPASSALPTPAERAWIFAQIDVESMVTIFFSDRAHVQNRLLPDEMLALGRLAAEKPEPRKPATTSPLIIAYHDGDENLKLVAERLQVDLLVADVESSLRPYGRNRPADADLYVEGWLISRESPAVSFWLSHCRHSGDSEGFSPPWHDELAWLLEQERLNSEQQYLLPLFNLPYTVFLPKRLRDVRFFMDGTLDFEDAWIAEEPVAR